MGDPVLKLFAEGKIKKRIIPGTADVRSIISKSDDNSYVSQLGDNECSGKGYVQTDSKYYEEANKYGKLLKANAQYSNMDAVDSITYAGSVSNLRDLDIEEIKYFQNYQFKTPTDKTNKLEIFKFKKPIIQTINANSTVLISGITGCGKSTQVPQYILDDCMERKKYCNIIVTQPRRIAAISVSKQVNNERNWKSGLIVGYQVGRKRDYDPNTTKILYCTTGILLQKIIKAKSLTEFTHIILDEVHERSLEMDFLLLVIRKLTRANSQSTRVILMSATFAVYKFLDYFMEYYGPPHNTHVRPPVIEIKEKVNHSTVIFFLDDLLGVIPSAGRMEVTKPQIDEAGYSTAISLVKAFDGTDKDGMKSSVLIFLPGIFEIEEMHRLMEIEMNSENHKWILLPLHSTITSEEQDRVFDKPIINYRKIILSTNIAESSITVPDVSYVIDFCLMKQLKNEMKSNYSMLVMTWASISNCEQRAGRVGRVSDGRVYRLVPKDMFMNEFDKEEVPEMSRCSLSRIVLMSKIFDMGTPTQLLGLALDPPSLKNITLTILTLKQVGALLPTVNGMISAVDGDITFMGKVMAHLPLEPPMSKLIYFGYIFNILDDAIIMACGLSIKSIFSQPFNKRLEAYAQKLIWANHSCSDPIAYIGPYQNWLQQKPIFDRNRNSERKWAQNNYIQLSAIRELYDLVEDVAMRLKSNFGIIKNTGKMKWTKPEEKAMASKVILAGAFYPNYFIRGISNAYMDEQEVRKILDDHDPNRTVYFTGFPNDQPKELYKEALENMFPTKFVGKPEAYFSSSNKVYIKFPMLKLNNMRYGCDKDQCRQLVPGDISFGVYLALKMAQLKMDFKVPLLMPADAKNRVEIITKQMANQKISQKKILPIAKCILEGTEKNRSVIDITVSHFVSVGCFWAQLFDDSSQKKLIEIWSIVNEKLHLTSADPNNLTLLNFYIIMYKNEKYRGKMIDLPHGPQKKCKILLVDFGDVLELDISNVFDILNEDEKNLIYGFPSLAFQCTIAKIRPAINGKPENNWSNKANQEFIKHARRTDKLDKLQGTIYSIVDGIVSFEDIIYIKAEKNVSIVEILIKNKLANRAENSFASKIDHQDRLIAIVHNSSMIHEKHPTSYIHLKSPLEKEAYMMHFLKGPFSPLEMSVNGINNNAVNKMIKIESQSINSVLLDTNPNEYHERLFVAGNVCINENDRLTLWDTTMMPNMPGMPAIICLIFSPCVEIRYNPSYTKIIGALCGLGFDPETARPLFQDNDIEITFDTIMDHKFIHEINKVRMLLNKCVNPEDHEGPGDIFEIQHKLQTLILDIFSRPAKFKAPEPLPKKYVWGIIPQPRLQSPYQNNIIDHPMAGSDVYKLLWGAELSKQMSPLECKQLLYKLSKIKRLQDGFQYHHFTSELGGTEELCCPLCLLTFSNVSSLKMHFKNYQHIERYNHAKEELQFYYKGPFYEIRDL